MGHMRHDLRKLTGVGLAIILLAGCGGTSTSRDSETPASSAPAIDTTTTTTTESTPTSVEPAGTKHFTHIATVSAESFKGNSLVAVSLRSPRQSFLPDGTPLGTLNEPNNGVDFQLTSGYSKCGEIQIASREDGTSILYGERRRSIPAAGIQPRMIEHAITAWDTEFNKLWETTVVKEPWQGGSPECSSIGNTSDGKWITTEIGNESVILDATNGNIRKLEFTLHPLGRYVVRFCNDCTVDHFIVEVIDPATLKTVVQVADDDVAYDTITPYGVIRDATNRYAIPIGDGSQIAVAFEKYDAKLDLTSGRLLWHQTNKNLARSGGPIDDNEKILISGKSDFVRALSLDSGTELWRIEGSFKVCYVGNEQTAIVGNEQLIIINTRTGAQIDYTSDPDDCQSPIGPYTFNSIYNGHGTNIYKLVDE